MAEEMGVLNSNKCKTCGGDLVLIGDTYYCQYCENVYMAETSQAENGESRVGSATEKSQLKEHSGVDVFEDNIDGVVEITWSDEKYKHSGSGYVITKDGYVITNTHVVTHENGASCNRVRVRVRDTDVTADVVVLGDRQHGLGSGIDLAIIKLNNIPSGIKPVKFAEFDKVKNGQKVYVIGNSLGYGTCITSGIVSDRLRRVDGKMLLMTDCAINGGNSGGPMFNDNGEVIGTIVSGIDGAEGMNFAIPCSDVINFIGSNQPNIKPQMAGATQKAKVGDTGATCPKCGLKTTQYTEGGFWWCTTCDYEW